jgi:dTDP-4-dehydrorhamnose 3,5-epimerase
VNILPTALAEVCVLVPRRFEDARGFFAEVWNARTFAAGGLDLDFVQDNHSHSRAGVLRGLHYQLRQPQGKLVRAVTGEVYDVAVDLRRSSPTFGRHVGVHLSAGNGHMLWIPPGFAHAFYVLSEAADVLYKCTDYHAPEHERTLLWNDPVLGIGWPLRGGAAPILSAKDARAVPVREAECYP